jgi:hypothetical protein
LSVLYLHEEEEKNTQFFAQKWLESKSEEKKTFAKKTTTLLHL